MINEKDIAVAAVAAPAADEKKKYKKREAIFETKFSFTDANLSRVGHRSLKNIDRRYDTKIPGLCCLVGKFRIVFYAYKKVPQYNKKTNTWEKNNVYKKMFPWAKNTGFNCKAARDKVSTYLDKIVDSKSKTQDEITFGDLAKRYCKDGLTGFKLQGNEARLYKPSVIKQYTSIINSYLLLETCTALVKKKLTAPVDYNGIIFNKPLKDYKASELSKRDLEAFKFRLKDTPQICTTILKTVSTIYTWARSNEIFKGNNPMEFVKIFPKNAIKVKLPDDKRDQILDYAESKAFDYNPHFLTIVTMNLLSSCNRDVEMFPLVWEQPLSEADKEKCSGWLEPDWQNLSEKRYIFLRDTKNRKDFRVYIRTPLKKLLIRLRKKLYEDPKLSWCLNSPYIFPKTKFKQADPSSHVDYNSLKYHLWRLNERFGLIYEKDGREKMFYTFKIGRKTFGSRVAKEKGIETAARALNHSDPRVTREHYIVPDQDDLDFEFESKETNIENFDKHRFEKVKNLK